jgi:DNA-binding response OmpR family regulator
MQFCPNCACDLTQFAPVSFGNVAIDEHGAIVYEGRPVSLRRGQHEIIESLVRAKGRRLSRGLLASRLDRDIEDRTIIKYIERSRMAFRSIDPAFDQIEAQRGFGTYSWTFRKAA